MIAIRWEPAIVYVLTQRPTQLHNTTRIHWYVHVMCVYCILIPTISNRFVYSVFEQARAIEPIAKQRTKKKHNTTLNTHTDPFLLFYFCVCAVVVVSSFLFLFYFRFSFGVRAAQSIPPFTSNAQHTA